MRSCKGRGYVTPQDVKSIGMDVLRHRVAITYEAEAEEKTSENDHPEDFRRTAGAVNRCSALSGDLTK